MMPIRLMLIFLCCGFFICKNPLLAQKKFQKPSTSKAKQEKTSLMEMFAEAQKLYGAGKYQQAIRVYDQILKRYPEHEPSIIQYAKALYKLEQTDHAYRLFMRVNPQHLDPETGYEYGQVFFRNNQFRYALPGFQRVPEGHPLSDLANYYGGICAMKMGQYDKAESMMEKAVVLPDKLSKSRTLYLKHLEKMRLIQQKKTLAKEREQEKNKLAETSKAKTPLPPQPATPVDTKYQHKGFQSISTGADLGYSLKNTTLDYSGFREETSKNKTAAFDFYSGPLIPLPLKAGNNQAAFGLQLNLGYRDIIVEGRERFLVVDDENPDIVRIQNQDPSIAHLKLGIASVNPWLEFPLNAAMWISVGGTFYMEFPNIGVSKKRGSRDAFTLFSTTQGIWTVETGLSYLEVIDNRLDILSSQLTIQLGISVKPTPAFKLKLDAAHNEFDYFVTEEEVQAGSKVSLLDGPDSSTSLKLTASHSFPLGIAVGGSGTVELQNDYIHHDLPAYGHTSANGTLYTGKIFASISPIQYISFSTAYLVQQLDWVTNNTEAQESYDRNEPDFIDQLEGKVVLNVLF